jgi:hypothetical protein
MKKAKEITCKKKQEMVKLLSDDSITITLAYLSEKIKFIKSPNRFS